MATKKQKLITQDTAKHIITGIKAPQVYSYQTNDSIPKTKKKDSIVRMENISGIDRFDNYPQMNNIPSKKEQDNSGMTIFMFDFQRNLSNIETKQSLIQNDVNIIKSTLNKHEQEIYSHDAIHRVKQLDSKLKNVQSQVNDLVKTLDKEVTEKGKFNAMHVEAYNKLQDHINSQLSQDKNTFNNAFFDIQRENNALKNQITKIDKEIKDDIKRIDRNLRDLELTSKNLDKEYKNGNMKSVDEIQILKTEVLNTNNTIRNNFNSKLEKLVNEFNTNDKNSKAYVDEKHHLIIEKMDNNFKTLNDSITEVKMDVDKNVNDIMKLFKLTDDKIEKIDKTVLKIEKDNSRNSKELHVNNTTTRKHEEAIIRKLGILENQLYEYVNNANRKMEQLGNDVEEKLTRQKSSDSLLSTSTATLKSSINTPEKIKEELLLIINEKEKLSYNGMLAVEKKFLNIQTQLESFKNEFNKKSKQYSSNKTINQLKIQMGSFEHLLDHVQDAQKKLNQKINQEIPESINELSMKTNNDLKALDNKYTNEINQLQNSITELNKSKKSSSKEMDENNRKRTRHEEIIMNKLLKLEGDLNSYLNLKMKEAEEIDNNINSNKNNSRLGSKHSRTSESTVNPEMDLEKIRAELMTIVNSKSKLTYQATLIVEEKVINLQERLNNFRKELTYKLGTKQLDDPKIIELQKQMESVNSVLEDMEKVQKNMKEKLDDELPSNIEEMSMKMKNALNLIGRRITQEEEERYLAVKELQEVYDSMLMEYKSSFNDIQKKNKKMKDEVDDMKNDLDSCKVAIKKLAESMMVFKSNLENQLEKK
uniref:Viral A-type inclusion protein n=1 Tax=Strongyloides papillosus TaxID=174720 RepID=A0A0N5BLA9_STREA